MLTRSSRNNERLIWYDPLLAVKSEHHWTYTSVHQKKTKDDQPKSQKAFPYGAFGNDAYLANGVRLLRGMFSKEEPASLVAFLGEPFAPEALARKLESGTDGITNQPGRQAQYR